MSGKSYSTKATENDSTLSKDTWTTAADQAAKKAEAEVEKIKQEAHEQLTSGKENFHNPDDE